MRLKSFCATVCVAALASVATAQDVEYSEYLGAIKVAPGIMPLAADADGRIFYGTFSGANSVLRVIEDPSAEIGNAVDAGTTISVFPAFANGRGLQSLQVTGAGNVLVAGDTGNAALGNVWKFNKVAGPPVSYVEDAAFTAAVTANSPARKSGVAVIDDTNNGVFVANGFTQTYFFDYTGALLSGPFTVGSNYMREIQYNSNDNVLYPLRNGAGSNNMIDYYLTNVSVATGGTKVTETLIEDGASNGASGTASQNGFHFSEQNQLVTLDGDVTISGQRIQPKVRVWDIVDNGTSLSLAYEFDGISETEKFQDIRDAVISNNRLYVDSASSASIFVFGPSTASVSRWDAYENK